MHRATTRFKTFAAALALAMFAGVALPVLAFACEAGQQQHTMLTMCCMDGEGGHQDPMPCHEEAPSQDMEPPGEHFAACCSSSDLVTLHEATRAENPEPPRIQVLALVESLWAADEGSAPIVSFPVDERPPATEAEVGLPVLYGALLN